nr:immunoglobulin heavy chain junction region [Macaca mulatta]MOV87224.1 immunoglobulin heavy chain junction region [Macaca mulatta]MOV88585.1 immunoglobulin heavy chain junction region [Macaca mulatta]MOV88708.1 immunoglobulin heavy chain junction region [Macaca mulatta]MOV88763.1 immunoglobulin heavy chain junction region [Macaca mulatta]
CARGGVDYGNTPAEYFDFW